MQTDRRAFLTTALGGAAALRAQTVDRDWSGRNPVRYPDADILVLDKKFAKYKIGNTPIQRLHTGLLWAEGPAWSSAGRYLVFSDIPNNVQMRWLEDDGHVSVFRNPSGFSNGNTFDFEGRQLSCEHVNQRVVRYEHNGTVTVLAGKWNSKPFNAPNDIVVHPDGGIWFTDPGYGILVAYEGKKADLQLKEAVYRIDGKTGKLTMVTDELYKPNGLCFSPDYKSCTCATPARRTIPTPPRSFRFTTSSMARACKKAAATYRRSCRVRARDLPTASAPTPTAISGWAWDGSEPVTMACTFSIPKASASE
jgi:gluconolactonase